IAGDIIVRPLDARAADQTQAAALVASQGIARVDIFLYRVVRHRRLEAGIEGVQLERLPILHEEPSHHRTARNGTDLEKPIRWRCEHVGKRELAVESIVDIDL